MKDKLKEFLEKIRTPVSMLSSFECCEGATFCATEGYVRELVEEFEKADRAGERK